MGIDTKRRDLAFLTSDREKISSIVQKRAEQLKMAFRGVKQESLAFANACVIKKIR